VSRHPFVWRPGQPQSLRASLYKKLSLAAGVGREHGVQDSQLSALHHGRDVTFSTEQLRSFFPRGNEHPALPPDLGMADAWLLTDDDHLSPA
jgi:hypothetical protein